MLVEILWITGSLKYFLLLRVQVSSTTLGNLLAGSTYFEHIYTLYANNSQGPNRNVLHIEQIMCTRKFILFVIAPKWLQSRCPSTVDSINTLQYPHIMENSSAVTLKSMDHGPADSASPGSLSGVQILGSLFRPSELEILKVRLNAVLTSPLYDSDTRWILENTGWLCSIWINYSLGQQHERVAQT